MLPANRGLSQVATSFIASRCQGIHRTPLVAWLKNHRRSPPENGRNEHSRRFYAWCTTAKGSRTMPTVTLAFNCQRPLERTRCSGARLLRTGASNPVRFLGRLGPGGDERNRTVDLRLAKPALSQLSYIPACSALRAGRAGLANSQWWARVESNYRPRAYQARALTN